MVNDEHEKARLTTVQALALMSVREAGCGREAKGWVYSGMSFRMACDLGLNLDSGSLPGSRESHLSDEEIDARRITFWGCYLFDKYVVCRVKLWCAMLTERQMLVELSRTDAATPLLHHYSSQVRRLSRRRVRHMGSIHRLWHKSVACSALTDESCRAPDICPLRDLK
jgi:hypothetical protein